MDENASETMMVDEELNEREVSAAPATTEDQQNEIPARTAARKSRRSSHDIEKRYTVRRPEWSYLRLKLTSDPPLSATESPDLLTWRSHLSAAVNQFLGISGQAVPIDILHLNNDEAWLRLPRDDLAGISGAITSWSALRDGKMVGFRILGSTEFLMGIVGGTGREIFAA